MEPFNPPHLDRRSSDDEVEYEAQLRSQSSSASHGELKPFEGKTSDREPHPKVPMLGRSFLASGSYLGKYSVTSDPLSVLQTPILFDSADFIQTASGNKVAVKSVLCGSHKIHMAGKSIIHPGVVLRGDLASLRIGKFVSVGRGTTLRPPFKTGKTSSGYIPMSIGDYVTIGEECVISAASIANHVLIGNNCVIGKRCMLKDCCIILPGTILPPDTVVPPMTAFGGIPGRFVGDLFESAAIAQKMSSPSDSLTVNEKPVPNCLRPPSINTEVFRLNGWTFVCSKGPIWGNTDFERSSQTLIPDASPIDRCPDAFFGHNCLELHCVCNTDNQSLNTSSNSECCKNSSQCNGCRWCLTIAPLEAVNGMLLKNWDGKHCFPESLKFYPKVLTVPEAELWKSRVATFENELSSAGDFERISPKYDWTCSSKYWGTIRMGTSRTVNDRVTDSNTSTNTCRIEMPAYPIVSPSTNDINSSLSSVSDWSSSIQILKPEDPSPLPLNLLTDTTLPILWFQQCDLFADDLSDSGNNSTDVKLRVMPTFWFAVYRQLVRVDNVALRCVDVRFFHLFGCDHIIRECIWKEADYNTLRKRMPSQSTTVVGDVILPPVPTFEYLRQEDVVFRIVQTLVLPVK